MERTNETKRASPASPKKTGARGARPPIVAIGASAGGLEAITELLRGVPANIGLAYVVIQHLDPNHASQLTEVLRRAIPLRVHEITDRMIAEADHVYVIPSSADVSFQDGAFSLQPRTQEPKRLHLPIDLFFEAVAADRGDKAIGVVLSGTGEDGSEGLKAIRAEGGITLVQAPGTAKFAGMPEAAIRTGAVDIVLSIPELAAELVRIGQHPYLGRDATESKLLADEHDLPRILDHLRRATGVDFGEYKPASIHRRLARRLALLRIDTLGEYARRLDDDAAEVKALFEDLLIHVSSFFRDPEVFDQLKRLVFPEIAKGKRDGGTIRIWVPGCSTGQEVYSIVIALVEFLTETGESHVPIQVFGTDLSDRALDLARAGVYAESAARVIGPERLQRYFTKAEGGGFRIAKSIRDRVAFVRHDMGSDPPFSKLDLVSCRNVLIYMAPQLQKRVIATFQFALAHPGFLVLGRSENVAAGSSLFAAVDQGNQIYARTMAKSTRQLAARDAGAAARQALGPAVAPVDVVRLSESVLLEKYAPCGVVVNDRMEILQFRGRTAPYLEPTPGQPQHHLLRMAKKGLVADLGVAIAQARESGSIVYRRNVPIESDGSLGTCDLAVIPVAAPPEWPEHVFTVVFESSRRGPDPGPPGLDRSDEVGDEDLDRELQATKAYLQTVLDRQQQVNDDLVSSNQDLVSGNEELQSLNEELGTAKEELQSTNEELSTLNEELHNRNDELDSVNGDLVNILASVEVPIVIVDAARCIRRFTPKARPILNLIPSDVGRPIDDIRGNITIEGLDRKIAAVIETSVTHEEETIDRGGHWYRLQIRPYATLDGRVDGAVLSIVDVDSLKRALGAAEAARDDATATLGAAAEAQHTAERANRTKDDFLATLSHELRTPLSSLLLQAQLLRRGPMDAEKLARTAQAIERATKAQAQLIDDLLDVSRIVAGKLRLERQEVNLAAVAAAAVESVRPSAERKALSLEMESEGAAVVSGDPGRLQQVVLNLLTNAIKFTPEYGHVAVTVGTDDGVARLTVKDDGVGMDPDFLPLIFERFSQEHEGQPRTHAGLGLGLAIVQHLVAAHGGTIRAESAGRDRGATFTILLPRAAADRPEEIEAMPSDQAARRGVQGLAVLVVDDDPDTLQALAETLGEMGAAVETAGTVREAMVRFRARRPSLLISDLSMPEEGGYGLIGRIRGLDPSQGGNVPALALTALALEEDRRSALRAGFDAHVAKPVAIDRLVGAIHNVLGQRATLLDLELFPPGLSH